MYLINNNNNIINGNKVFNYKLLFSNIFNFKMFIFSIMLI